MLIWFYSNIAWHIAAYHHVYMSIPVIPTSMGNSLDIQPGWVTQKILPAICWTVLLCHYRRSIQHIRRSLGWPPCYGIYQSWYLLKVHEIASTFWMKSPISSVSDHRWYSIVLHIFLWNIWAHLLSMSSHFCSISGFREMLMVFVREQAWESEMVATFREFLMELNSQVCKPMISMPQHRWAILNSFLRTVFLRRI